MGIRQSPVRRPRESVGGQQLARARERADGAGEFGVDPGLVARGNRPRERRRKAQVDQANDGLAVDGQGNGLAETAAVKERLGLAVEIEEQEIVLQARTQVLKRVSAAFPVLFQDGVVPGR